MRTLVLLMIVFGAACSAGGCSSTQPDAAACAKGFHPDVVTCSTCPVIEGSTCFNKVDEACRCKCGTDACQVLQSSCPAQVSC